MKKLRFVIFAVLVLAIFTGCVQKPLASKEGATWKIESLCKYLAQNIPTLSKDFQLSLHKASQYACLTDTKTGAKIYIDRFENKSDLDAYKTELDEKFKDDKYYIWGKFLISTVKTTQKDSALFFRAKSQLSSR